MLPVPFGRVYPPPCAPQGGSHTQNSGPGRCPLRTTGNHPYGWIDIGIRQKKIAPARGTRSEAGAIFLSAATPWLGYNTIGGNAPARRGGGAGGRRAAAGEALGFYGGEGGAAVRPMRLCSVATSIFGCQQEQRPCLTATGSNTLCLAASRSNPVCGCQQNVL